MNVSFYVENVKNDKTNLCCYIFHKNQKYKKRRNEKHEKDDILSQLDNNLVNYDKLIKGKMTRSNNKGFM